MRSEVPIFERHRQLALLCRCVVALLAPLFQTFPIAADDELIYTLNETGRLSINGTVLDSLVSTFDPDDAKNAQQRWLELAVAGADRYALRADGQLFKNGKRLYLLQFQPTVPFQWLAMKVGDDGVIAIREDGLIAVNGTLTAFLPIVGADDVAFPFMELVFAGDHRYALRGDGALFKDEGPTAVFQFQAGPGAFTGLSDGLVAETLWLDVAIDPVDGHIYALRADGHLYRADPADEGSGGGAEIPGGELVTEMPFPLTPTFADLYFEVEFTQNGEWKGIRRDGQLFSEISPQIPHVDYPGDRTEGDHQYVDLTTSGDDFWVIRRDGRVYKNFSVELLFKAPKRPYGRIALTSTPPDLSRFKNQKPVVAVYKTTVVEGEDVSIPLIATDGDKRFEDLVITPDRVPAGAVWDAGSRVLNWAAAGPQGKYLFTVTVDDGKAKPKTFKQTIKIIAPDALLDKNKPPIVAKVKKLQALVGYELVVPVFATDPDGDSLAFSVDTNVYPFTEGATFDVNNVFRWTPVFEDIGKTKVVIEVSDGAKRKRLSLKIVVISPLIF